MLTVYNNFPQKMRYKMGFMCYNLCYITTKYWIRFLINLLSSRLFCISFWNRLIWAHAHRFLRKQNYPKYLFSLNNWGAELRSTRPTISWFQKEIQNLLIERIQIDKTFNPRYVDNIEQWDLQAIFKWLVIFGTPNLTK